jgi:protein-S-isoprenylcysteine O-methyltransferase Ste14
MHPGLGGVAGVGGLGGMGGVGVMQPNAMTRQPNRAWLPGGFFAKNGPNYFSFISLYSTCLRALGSNFMISIFSGMVFLFFVVV